ncbi:PPK2 family polyphosphate:nucleotide phosphotransferase [Humibacillus xanthopallidus]|uniref:PPK2 family polyphosphate:nucleotide phosphotransferase n=1 Tax=Humibacillus xanthopallidus TaxID=412689 RepID=A0A543PUC4_9MICO|nr:polyphosphate kinase 2 family protein [Humibacillus xanthopallidus]TQN47660.1 PPK2 family polyphosphate:nucleotide phosphotransferase [Humibacillus xanthopallidus]
MGKGKKDKKKKLKDSSGKGAKKAAKKAEKVSDAREEISEDGARLGGFADALRVGKGFSLVDVDTGSTPAFDGDEEDGEAALEAGHAELSDLMERLFAESTAGSKRALLLVVQGMDTSGKGGLMRHVISVNPQSVRATAFKQPTPEELAHDFLWRVEKALPAAGQLGVFDRSHYEDVLVVRVHDIVPPEVWQKRYAQINAFERRVDRSGTKVIKVMTHISKEEQRERLLERLDRPDKYYKYNPGDVDERSHWLDYMEAYQAVLDKTSTVAAPWHVVPADHKWYARLAVQQLLLEALRSMNLTWPAADFDIEVEKKRLAES